MGEFNDVDLEFNDVDLEFDDVDLEFDDMDLEFAGPPLDETSQKKLASDFQLGRPEEVPNSVFKETVLADHYSNVDGTEYANVDDVINRAAVDWNTIGSDDAYEKLVYSNTPHKVDPINTLPTDAATLNQVLEFETGIKLEGKELETAGVVDIIKGTGASFIETGANVAKTKTIAMLKLMMGPEPAGFTRAQTDRVIEVNKAMAAAGYSSQDELIEKFGGDLKEALDWSPETWKSSRELMQEESGRELSGPVLDRSLQFAKQAFMMTADNAPMLIAASIAGAPEAFVMMFSNEKENLYDNLIEQGLDPEVAEEFSGYYGMISAPIEYIENMGRVGKSKIPGLNNVKKNLKKSLKKKILSKLGEAGVNITEELAQGEVEVLIYNLALESQKQRDPTFDVERRKQFNVKEMLGTTKGSIGMSMVLESLGLSSKGIKTSNDVRSKRAQSERIVAELEIPNAVKNKAIADLDKVTTPEGLKVWITNLSDAIVDDAGKTVTEAPEVTDSPEVAALKAEVAADQIEVAEYQKNMIEGLRENGLSDDEIFNPMEGQEYSAMDALTAFWYENDDWDEDFNLKLEDTSGLRQTELQIFNRDTEAVNFVLEMFNEWRATWDGDMTKVPDGFSIDNSAPMHLLAKAVDLNSELDNSTLDEAFKGKFDKDIDFKMRQKDRNLKREINRLQEGEVSPRVQEIKDQAVAENNAKVVSSLTELMEISSTLDNKILSPGQVQSIKNNEVGVKEMLELLNPQAVNVLTKAFNGDQDAINEWNDIVKLKNIVAKASFKGKDSLTEAELEVLNDQVDSLYKDYEYKQEVDEKALNYRGGRRTQEDIDAGRPGKKLTLSDQLIGNLFNSNTAMGNFAPKTKRRLSNMLVGVDKFYNELLSDDKLRIDLDKLKKMVIKVEVDLDKMAKSKFPGQVAISEDLRAKVSQYLLDFYNTGDVAHLKKAVNFYGNVEGTFASDLDFDAIRDLLDKLNPELQGNIENVIAARIEEATFELEEKAIHKNDSNFKKNVDEGIAIDGYKEKIAAIEERLAVPYAPKPTPEEINNQKLKKLEDKAIELAETAKENVKKLTAEQVKIEEELRREFKKDILDFVKMTELNLKIDKIKDSLNEETKTVFSFKTNLNNIQRENARIFKSKKDDLELKYVGQDMAARELFAKQNQKLKDLVKGLKSQISKRKKSIKRRENVMEADRIVVDQKIKELEPVIRARVEKEPFRVRPMVQDQYRTRYEDILNQRHKNLKPGETAKIEAEDMYMFESPFTAIDNLIRSAAKFKAQKEFIGEANLKNIRAPVIDINGVPQFDLGNPDEIRQILNGLENSGEVENLSDDAKEFIIKHISEVLNEGNGPGALSRDIRKLIIPLVGTVWTATKQKADYFKIVGELKQIDKNSPRVIKTILRNIVRSEGKVYVSKEKLKELNEKYGTKHTLADITAAVYDPDLMNSGVPNWSSWRDDLVDSFTYMPNDKTKQAVPFLNFLSALDRVGTEKVNLGKLRIKKVEAIADIWYEQVVTSLLQMSDMASKEVFLQSTIETLQNVTEAERMEYLGRQFKGDWELASIVSKEIMYDTLSDVSRETLHGLMNVLHPLSSFDRSPLFRKARWAGQLRSFATHKSALVWNRITKPHYDAKSYSQAKSDYSSEIKGYAAEIKILENENSATTDQDVINHNDMQIAELNKSMASSQQKFDYASSRVGEANKQKVSAIGNVIKYQYLSDYTVSIIINEIRRALLPEEDRDDEDLLDRMAKEAMESALADLMPLINTYYYVVGGFKREDLSTFIAENILLGPMPLNRSRQLLMDIWRDPDDFEIKDAAKLLYGAPIPLIPLNDIEKMVNDD